MTKSALLLLLGSPNSDCTEEGRAQRRHFLQATPSHHSLFLLLVDGVHFYFLKYIKVTKTNEEEKREDKGGLLTVMNALQDPEVGGGSFPFLSKS